MAVAIAGSVFIAGAGIANAGIVVSSGGALCASAVAPEGANFRWCYSALLEAGSRVDPNDFFTIYDINGLVPGSNLNPGNWAAGMNLSGTTPFGVTPADDAAVNNLTWTFSDEVMFDPSGAAWLGSFSFLSTSGVAGTDSFAAQASLDVSGTAVSNMGELAVPSAVISQVPEPGTFGLLGTALVGLAALKRRKPQLRASV